MTKQTARRRGDLRSRVNGIVCTGTREGWPARTRAST